MLESTSKNPGNAVTFEDQAYSLATQVSVLNWADRRGARAVIEPTVVASTVEYRWSEVTDPQSSGGNAIVAPGLPAGLRS